jgi:hypothetical protein
MTARSSRFAAPRTMTGSRLADCRNSRLSCVEASPTFASDEGGEFAGGPSECNRYSRQTYGFVAS